MWLKASKLQSFKGVMSQAYSRNKYPPPEHEDPATKLLKKENQVSCPNQMQREIKVAVRPKFVLKKPRTANPESTNPAKHEQPFQHTIT